MPVEKVQTTSPSETASLDYLEEHIVQHPKKEQWYDSPVYLTIYFAVLLVVGCALGLLLAIR